MKLPTYYIKCYLFPVPFQMPQQYVDANFSGLPEVSELLSPLLYVLIDIWPV